MFGWFSWLVGDDPADKDYGYGDKSLSEKTIIYCRSTSTPVQHWEATVLYDLWGTPYIKGNGSRARWGIVVIEENGHTDSVWGVHWKHKSGPEVTFGKQPESDPFERDPV